jgi:hypothetical protein
MVGMMVHVVAMMGANEAHIVRAHFRNSGFIADKVFPVNREWIPTGEVLLQNRER